ncbi:DUF6173 family protein [Vibrio diabolicus]|uniref:DUF6173 family protein n=1 Tax=Vibrio diabolicus TaxID=50719 RepID=UPI0035C70D81
MDKFNLPHIDSIADRLTERSLNEVNPAAWTYERLGEYIKDFEADLDSDHEIGARLVSFGQAVTFHIQDVGYYGPDIISFTGLDSNGKKVQLIQHMSQLSVLLVAMNKLEDEPKRIGFIWDKKETEEN